VIENYKKMDNIISLNIILLGNWNKRIFSPKWVNTNIFCLEEGSKYQGLINPEEMEFGYLHNDIVLLPRSSSLEIKLEKYNENTINQGGVILEKILQLLPHTPIKAIGINIRYRFLRKDNNKIVNSLRELKCSFSDFQTKQIKFSKNLEDCQLNIITDIGTEDFTVNFNFHFIQTSVIDKNVLVSKLQISEKLINYE
jgi:hypothetical protein